MDISIVYIDDEPALCRVVQIILSKQPTYGVVTFTDPEAAVAYIAQHDVSVVLCDYRMPSLNGLQVLERIGKPVPFVLVSGDLGVASLATSQPGLAGVLTKPIRPESLLEAIRVALQAA